MKNRLIGIPMKGGELFGGNKVTHRVAINPLLVGAIERYEAGGVDQPGKCVVRILGQAVKVPYAPETVADMLGYEVVVAEKPGEKKEAPPSPDAAAPAAASKTEFAKPTPKS